MTIGVNLKIDVTKIEKGRLYKGAKGTYLDAVVFINDDPDEYGQHGMITQAVTKEEKDNKVKGPILGNCKVFWKEEQAPRQPGQQQEPEDDMDSIPF
jgi:hypothetical protein